MSASLSGISSIVGKASAVRGALSQLFGGAGSVQLGGVTFDGMEVPESIKWGGKQSIVKHTIPGGVVKASAMGIEYAPISWSGIFEGFFSISRSRQLYTMMVAGVPVPLSWNDRSYTVLIESYEADDTKENWIPYHVTCCVINDETLSSVDAAPSLLAQVTGDIAGAIGITPAQLTNGVGTALRVASTASGVIGAVTGGTGASVALTASLGLAQTAVGGAISLANSQVATLAASTLASGGSILPSGSAASGIANLGAALTAAGNLSVLPTIKGLVGRAQANMANAST